MCDKPVSSIIMREQSQSQPNPRNIKTAGIPVNPRGGVSRGKWDGDELRRVKQERQVWVLNGKINDLREVGRQYLSTLTVHKRCREDTCLPAT